MTVPSRVPMYEHGKLYQLQKQEIDDAVRRVIEKGVFDWGDEVAAFEEEFASWNGVEHAVSVNSGTAAIKIALLAANVGRGDEVITVPNTDISSSSGIRHTGADVVWVDIEPLSRTMDTQALRRAITNRTKAILPVDLFGHPANMPEIMDIASQQGLVVIEDACLALGATIDGRKVGGFATATCFSFAPKKHLGSYGSGGAILTRNGAFAERMRKLSAYGQSRHRHRSNTTVAGNTGLYIEEEGSNEQLDELQAAILRVKLRDFAQTLGTRRNQAARYSQALRNLPLDLPNCLEGFEHAWRNYVLEHDDRDRIRLYLSNNGVQTNLSYSPPMHLQPVYRSMNKGENSFPVTERSCSRLFGLPIGPHIDDEQLEHVLQTLHNFFGSH
ncbi:DegT/DnrJ/EryC1/StrS family aminotransferase [Rhizobium leguminosarum]|uniref:DegT/DnrJ/EryC1/StrS family aminotransferase n=1 Tax=Rhizobium leguminosarum TaxID=384 RepID=UPI001C9897FA|nr:DegT/DnrJ/EryC1/StrS family aminotransferase [Rhizobium leguminosarum]MBY5357667.1 DegT/DnrJ/EryC1/StrS family aminotransferase [Rhizobium leguminosarum]